MNHKSLSHLMSPKLEWSWKFQNKSAVQYIRGVWWYYSCRVDLWRFFLLRRYVSMKHCRHVTRYIERRQHSGTLLEWDPLRCFADYYCNNTISPWTTPEKHASKPLRARWKTTFIRHYNEWLTWIHNARGVFRVRLQRRPATTGRGGKHEEKHKRNNIISR